jgi:hypothetical protein
MIETDFAGLFGIERAIGSMYESLGDVGKAWATEGRTLPLHKHTLI